MKKILSLLAVSMMLTTVVGCGTEKKPQENVSIKVAYWDAGMNKRLPNLIEGFKKKYPNIDVQAYDIPSADYTTKLSVMLNGGSDLDAFFIKDGDTTKGLADKGQLADLSSYIKKDKVNLNNYNGLAKNFTFNEKTYALPASSSYYVLYYNKDIFDAAGVKYPSNDMTWADFESLASKLTSGSGATKKYGALFHTWNACVQNWGLVDGKHTILDQDLTFFKPYYEMILRMQKAGTIMDYGTLKTSNLHYSNLFMQGNTAMLPMGSWFIATLLNKKAAGETKVNWGVATLPHPEGVKAGNTVGSVTPIAVNAASKKQEAAWKFVSFVASEEGSKIQAGVGEFPSVITPETLKSITELPGMPANALEALQVKNVSLDRPVDTKSAQVNKMLGEQHGLILLGENSIDKGIAEMQKLSKEIQGK